MPFDKLVIGTLNAWKAFYNSAWGQQLGKIVEKVCCQMTDSSTNNLQREHKGEGERD